MHDRFPSAAPSGIVLRPMIEADLSFAGMVYASTRAEELAATGWPMAAQTDFLAQQHQAQHAHYQQHYRGMDAMILERAGQPIGRLYLFESDSEIRIVDIALMPDARGAGIGRALLGDILADAGRRHMIVSIHVERTNRARTLYARLGFVPTDTDHGIYELWEWTSGADHLSAS